MSLFVCLHFEDSIFHAQYSEKFADFSDRRPRVWHKTFQAFPLLTEFVPFSLCPCFSAYDVVLQPRHILPPGEDITSFREDLHSTDLQVAFIQHHHSM